MRKLLLPGLLAFLTFLAVPLAASADHLDVIEIKLMDGCTPEKWVAIVHDFNTQWGKDHGYRAEALVPLQSQDLVSVYWVGRSANAAAFGAAWDAWRDALPDAKTTAAKLQARFDKCSTNVSRSSYDVY